jgi:hypothetical protein
MNKVFSNTSAFGGEFNSKVKNEFVTAEHVTIASGYVSTDIIQKFELDFLRIAQKGSFKLMVGMAFYEGLTTKCLKLLSNINSELSKINTNSGVFVCFTKKFHGKVYSFENKNSSNIYVGSSNFSITGLSTNFECTIKVEDIDTKDELRKYLNFIFSPQNAVCIDKASIKETNSRKFRNEMFSSNITGVKKFNPAEYDLTKLPYFQINLRDSVTKKHQKSNLNAYFGKGRENKITGKVLPRPWYEAELIARVTITENELYPIGNFDGYTDDGYIIPMRTQGDYNKNIRSQNSLQILGVWIKGKLQRAGALIPLTPVTEEVLDKYGNDTINFYKIADGKYFLQFLPNMKA